MKVLDYCLTAVFCAFLMINTFSAVADADLKNTNNDLRYVVKQNDTIWGICKTYVDDPLCWKKLVEYNQVVNPKYLPPNSIISIPQQWLKAQPTTALVVAVEGEVSLTRNGDDQRYLLNVGDILGQQDTVQALNGSAMIEFADQSRLLLKANSIIRMATLQYNDVTQLVNTRIELLKGRVKASVEKATNDVSRYEIETPAAVAAVRGTEFRVASDSGENGQSLMRTELLTGALLVSSDTNAQTLGAGEAVMAEEGKGVAKPVQLLPRPEMVVTGARSFQLPYRIRWQPLNKAKSYIITLLQDDIQIREESTQDTFFDIQNMIPGSYQLLIRGVDHQGFEGRNRLVKVNLP